uniref:Uncharacterized protein n=1 Tax=Panagrolaimus sp. PS1159 TaxID=55785 RepID=A0AC35GFS4_9BILA
MRFIFVLVLFCILAVSNVFSADATVDPLNGVFIPYKMSLTVPVRSVIYSLDGRELEKLIQNHLSAHPISPAESSANTSAASVNPAPVTEASPQPPQNNQSQAPQLSPQTEGPQPRTEEPVQQSPAPRRKRREINIENVNESKYANNPELQEILRKAKEEIQETLSKSGNENLKAYYLHGTLTATPLI